MSRPSLASPEPHDVAGSTQPHLPTACLLHPFARSTLINKAGLLTGGSSPQERARASKWNQKEHEGLKSEQEALRRELESLPPAGSSEEREMALRHQIASRQQEVQAAGADFELTKQKLAKAKSELSTLTSSLATAEKGLAEAEAKLAKGEAEVRALQDKCDAKEDEIFSSFSRALGIASVREYEEKTLRAAREREAELLQLRQQHSKLNAQLLFERRKDLPAAADKLRASIAEDAKAIGKKAEKMERMAEKADSLKTQVAAAEAEAKESKQAQETATSELKALKKKLRDAMERMGGAKQRLQQTETELEQQRGHRLRLFQKARVENVTLPLVDDPNADGLHDTARAAEKAAAAKAAAAAERAASGAGTAEADAAADDEETGGGGGGGRKKSKRKRSSAGGSGSGGAPLPFGLKAMSALMASETFSPGDLVGTETLNGETDADAADDPMDGTGGASSSERNDGGGASSSSGGAGSQMIVRLDFSSLTDEERAGDAASVETALQEEIADVTRELDCMAPNMKAIEQYDEVSARLHAIETEFDESRAQAASIKKEFMSVQARRTALFMTAFRAVSEYIDDVYKDLTQEVDAKGGSGRVGGGIDALGGTAYLSLEDPTEPFLHGTRYSAMPAGKRFRDMDQLSGGERTVAALALLFAFHRFRPTPFFVMDEIDAALDNVNVTRVARYIRERAAEGSLQFVVISLKDTFYSFANGLVGIYRDRREEASACATIDLEKLTVEDVTEEAEDDEEDEADEEEAAADVEEAA